MGFGQIAFVSLLASTPFWGMLLGYARAYQLRLKGQPGQKLENIIGETAFLVTFSLAFVCFWWWPETQAAWYSLPGARHLLEAIIQDPAQRDPNYPSLKILFAVGTAGSLGILARLSAFPLNRHLVRQVPRFMRPEDEKLRRKPT